jgi:hypothetical protein
MKTLKLNTEISDDGKIRLEVPCGLPPGPAEVVVIIQSNSASGPRVDLKDRGIGREQAADLRGRLSAFSEDWVRPEMDLYDAL